MVTESHAPLAERARPDSTALLVVDVQNDFCHSDSPLARQGGADVSFVQAMIPRLLSFIEAARAAEVLVIWLRLVYSQHTVSRIAEEHRLRTRPDMDRICQEGSWGADFYRVEPEPGEPIVIKHRYSGFVDTSLDLLLRSRGIETVVVTGVATNVCVESTARDAFMRDYRLLLVEDCSATYDQARHEATLRTIDGHFGQVVRAETICQAWGQAID